MEKQYFLLGSGEDNRFVKLIRIIFGLVCIAVAAFWFVFNIKSSKVDGMLWITIIFLSGFGFYQIWSGLGLAIKFIEIGQDLIRLRKNPMLPAIVMTAKEIEKIELFPLNIVFILRSHRRIMLRFGTTYYLINENIKDTVLNFAETNDILLEVIEEKI